MEMNPQHTTNAKKELPLFAYKLMLVAATVIWGASFVIMKDAVSVMEPSWLLGVRFTATALIFLAVFWKRIRTYWGRDLLLCGLILGALLFAAYWTQTVGLKFTTPGKNAFLTAVYCVIVPFLFWGVAKRKPTIYNVAAAFLCVAGIGFVSLSNETLTIEFGDGMTLVSSAIYAGHIVATFLIAKRNDIMAITVIQFIVAGVLGLIMGAITEPLPQTEAITPEFLFNMAYLILLASCVAIGFQNIAVAKVPPAQSAIFLALEAVFGVIFSIILINEQLTIPLIVGFALILGAVILSEAFPLKKPPTDIDEAIAEDAVVVE